MSRKNYEVGKQLDAYCTKCKLDRVSTIETLKSDGNINRVICQTCEGSHLFRRPKSAAGKKSRASGAASRRRKGAVTVAEEDLKNAKPYAMDGAYDVGDIIQHKTFGPGCVLDVKADGKMEVGFETGGKLMICRDPRTPRPPKRAARRAAASGKAKSAS